MKFGYIPVFFSTLLLIGCATSKQAKVQDKPPGFVGRLFDNTVSRYNAYYNSNLVYETSISSAKDGFQENYDSLFAPSVQDAVARSGSVSGQMDEIIEKTTAMIEKKPYSKWVDDHFLLNGIAHYIKGDYEMAERIFRYVSSEFKNGVLEDRVTSRQKVKGAERAKELKKEADKKIKEAEKAREEREKEYEEQRKEREREAKERARRAKNTKKRNKRLKKAAEREAIQRRKAGLDVDAKEIVRDIKEQDRRITKKRNKISEEDKEKLASAPVAKMDESAQKEGLLAHDLAAKDALLWLAKTYITTENFIAANAVLTAINEDEYFPIRLNTDYYLTYADMHIRLDNKPKAIEYVQLAADSAKKNEKGRLYYLMGQMYADIGQWEKAEEAFNMVEKFHPYYDMIYHAKINNIERSYQVGDFVTEDFITPLKRMSKDAKNDDFLDEVYYYLGEAYAAKEQKEDAIKAFNQSKEYQGNDKDVSKRVHLALGQQYYKDKDFKKAQPEFENALQFIEADSPEHATTSIYSEKLAAINESLANIHLQDSLLALGEMPDDDLLKFIEKKVNQEIRQQFKDKLKEENENFGNSGQTNRNNRRSNRNRNVSDSDAFYFYDIQQSVGGYSEFKQEWGARPNVDNWRQSSTIERARRGARGNRADDYAEVEISSKEDMVANYLAEIPKTTEQKQAAKTSIEQSYLRLITIFTNSFGDKELAQFYTEELRKRNPSTTAVEKMREASVMNGSADNEEQLGSQEPLSEIEQLYNQTYDAYAAGKYEKAITLAEQSESFQNNDFKDKFAFIRAMSVGNIEGQEALIEAMNKFVQAYPSSTLREQALKLINQK